VVVNVCALVVGLAVLAKGADVFVHAAARLAVHLQISPVVVGAVIVGFGTSAPELLVSAFAAARGSLDIAAGNVIGSNLANLTLVLGIAGLICQPATTPRIARREAPLCVAAVGLVAVLVQNGFARWEGAILVAALAAALWLMLRDNEAQLAGGAVAAEVTEFVEQPGEETLAAVAAAPLRPVVTRLVVGLAATVGGAQLLVVGARGIADELGLSGGFVGLTVVAVGTSLPELMTSIQSARRGETELLAGNLLGSNVLNSTVVAGVAALVGPARLTDAGLTVYATLAMVGVAVLASLFLATGLRFGRVEAVLLLAIYAATLPLTA
jgi:cation:H+ antiporter